MSPLEARKRLLLLESDLNRALLTAEVQGLRSRAHWLADLRRRWPSFRQGLVLAAPIAGLLRRRRRRRRKPDRANHDNGRSWVSRLASALRLLGPAVLYLRRVRRQLRSQG